MQRQLKREQPFRRFIQNKDVSSHTPDQIRTKLKRLYLYYACLGCRSQFKSLTMNKFVRLLKDAGLLAENFLRNSAEILVTTEAKRSKLITFSIFCESIARLAKEKFPNEYGRQSPTIALYKLLDTFLLPLYNNLALSSDIELFEKEDPNIDSDCLVIVHKAYPALRQIYEKHFPWELGTSDTVEVVMQRSESAMLLFLQQFNITPDLINHVTAFKIWQDLVVIDDELPIYNEMICEDVGVVFTLKKFLVFLLRCGLLNNNYKRIISPADKFTYLLERIEMSPGFHSIENPNLKSNTSKMKLLATHKLSEMLNVLKGSENLIDTRASFSDTSKIDMSISVGVEAMNRIECSMDSLEHIFRTYCTQADPGYTRKLNCTKFTKLLLDAGLLTDSKQLISTLNLSPDSGRYSSSITRITKVDAQLIFTRVTSCKTKHTDSVPVFKPTTHLTPKDSDKGKLDINQFLKALELVAAKVFTDETLDISLPTMIEQYILNLYSGELSQSIDNIKFDLEIIRDPSLISLLKSIATTLQPYVKLYSDSRGLINFYNFFNFMKDFELFPYLIAKPKIAQIFYILTRQYMKNCLGLTNTFNLSAAIHQAGLPIDQNDSDVIDLPHLVDGISLCALQGSLPGDSPAEKIMSVIQKITQSRGTTLVPLKTGYPRTADLDRSDYLAHLPRRSNSAIASHATFEEMLKNLPLNE
jgi:hypothetical protein